LRTVPGPLARFSIDPGSGRLERQRIPDAEAGAGLFPKQRIGYNTAFYSLGVSKWKT
jgi:hypothetical protein